MALCPNCKLHSFYEDRMLKGLSPQESYSSFGKKPLLRQCPNRDAVGIRCCRRRSLAQLFLAFVGALIITSVLFVPSHKRTAANLYLLFKPTTYEVVPGLFAQSLNSTDDSTFDFVSSSASIPDHIEELKFRDFE